MRERERERERARERERESERERKRERERGKQNKRNVSGAGQFKVMCQLRMTAAFSTNKTFIWEIDERSRVIIKSGEGMIYVFVMEKTE